MDLGHNSKPVAIFKGLLARKGRSVSQDLLIGWLWPESNARRARWSLNSAVYSLRRILDESFSVLSSDSILLEKGSYRLSPEVQVSSDVEEFDARYERGRLLEMEGQGAEAVSEYEQAIELYREDYLVEDLYEDWTAVERERLINAYVDMLDRLANHHKRTGRTQEAINSRYRLLEKDPYHEESYQFLMRCYAHLGLRGRALHHYKLCERMFGNLYGSSPPPDIQALYRELLCEERKE